MMEKDTFRSLSQVVFIRGGRSVPPSIKPLNSGGRWQSDAGRRCERICRDSSHFRFIGTAYTIPRTSRILSRIDRSSLDYFLFYCEPMILDLTVDEIPKVKTSLRLFFLFPVFLSVQRIASIARYLNILWLKRIQREPITNISNYQRI